ncbi:MAG TPA: outer membrane beta-barrel protein [Candidatus Udaeobacter sp.]|jgi:hypothetical protein|nr:outer membrane beta-barrel protein [Candidatus Udaeobacter sp.]
MKRMLILIGILVAALTTARTGLADVSSATQESGHSALESLALGMPADAAEGHALAPEVDAMAEFGATPVTLGAVMYRPRSRYYRRSEPSMGSQAQVHAGFFDPEGDQNGTGFVLGMRGGPMVDPHIQLGLGVDWEHRSSEQSEVVGTSPGPGGTVITTRRQLSSSSENTFPILGFVQVTGDPSMPVVPYGGIGGGYEIVTLSATDFQSGSSFDATYGGWGWQAWGGAKIPLSGQASVLGEVYLNQSEPHRDVDDPTTGQTFREVVKVNGFGMRFGLSWGM